MNNGKNLDTAAKHEGNLLVKVGKADSVVSLGQYRAQLLFV